MTRRCMVYHDGVQCLGHPPVDDDVYPPVCERDLNELFGPLIHARARQMAREIVANERAEQRRRSDSFRAWQAENHPEDARRSREPFTRTPVPASSPGGLRLRKGVHLNDQDEAVLALLRGAA